MRNGRNVWMYAATITLVFAVGALEPAYGTDQLWQRAVASFQDSNQWVPFEYEMETREYNGRGDLKSHSRMLARTTVRPDGTTDMEIVEAEQLVGRGDPEQPFGSFPGADRENEDDGQDQDQDASQRFAAVSESPLDPAMQPFIDVNRLGTRTLQGRGRAVAYDFDLRPNEKARATGTVWLDPQSGLPLQIERDVDPPIGVIQSFRVRESYEPSDDIWLTKGFSVDVVGRVLLIERRFVMDMSFRDHRFDPETAAAMDGGRPGS